MPRQGVSKRSFFSGLVAFCLPVFALVAQEGDGGGLVPVKEIPDRFFQVQGSNGFFWQAVKNGAITSGETQYLQSGLNLLVDGENFAPAEAKVRQPGAEVPGMIELSGKLAGVAVVRSLLFDRERGAVRVIDAFENTAGKDLQVSVDLRTTYPFGWESLHGGDGGLLSRDPVLRLGEDDAGLIVHFSASEGRHDTMIVCGRGALRPALIGSANRRELTLRYDLLIPAGKTVSLLHFLGQITIPDMEDADEVFTGFLRPGLEPALAARVANYLPEAFTEVAVASGKPGTLTALNRFLDAVGVYRRSKDLLWLSPTSQLTGEVAPDAVVTVGSGTSDTIKLEFASIASIRGGSGIGRPGKVFLRDGTVRVGALSFEGMKFRADGESDLQEIDAESLHLLLGRTTAEDGLSPAGTTGFLELTSGEVLALAGEGASLPGIAPWGLFNLPLSSVRGIRSVREPVPSYRVLAVDGSRFPVFFSNEAVQVELPGGKKREVPANLISEFWQAGMENPAPVADSGEWLDFSEVPDSSPVKEGFLLRGNQLLAGSFADAVIGIRTGGPLVQVETKRIRSIRRILDVTKGGSNRYQVELKNGESLEGEIVGPFLTIARDGSGIRVSSDQLFAFRSL